jgi:L-ascorbate metabolism protein UlaG (beta-lactamase superfamily)
MMSDAMLKKQIDITWFPNSWIRIRSGRRVIYFDPAYLKTYFLNYKDKTEFSKWPHPIDGLPDGLEKADYIFITHHHKDHCKKVTSDRLRTSKTKIYAPASCKKELGEMFQTVKPGDNLQLDSELGIRVINAYNTETGSSTRKQHKKGRGVGYVLSIGTLTVYHAGDTDFIPDMTELGNIDVALIPIGGKFTMDIDEAIHTTLVIDPQIVIPIHHLDQNPEMFSLRLQQNEKCIIPKIGQPIIL